jgi:DNA-binding SARP family transcriptional activator/TolB-like protein/Tfp pilus assembly protein PilF
MSKIRNVTLRLLGTFAVQANVGRPIPISVRSRKARALLAYVGMKPNYRATREELATLFWGDNPDALARQSLRQCLISLRQDLSLASEILVVDREAIELRTQLIAVDARTFMSLSQSAAPDELARAAALWRGPFLSELSLDIEEFEAWHRQEAERLATAAAVVFEALCRNADASGDGESAITAAERLVALEPTREDRQRTALKMFARYRGPETALSQAQLLTDLLRRELGAAPETATYALIAAIKRGEFERTDGPDRAQPATQGPVTEAGLPATMPVSLPACECDVSSAPAPSVSAAAAVPRNSAADSLRFWHRQPRAVASAATALVLIGVIAALGLVNGWKSWLPLTDRQQSQTIAILPFVADSPGQSDNPAFARIFTHDLIGYLSRFGTLRVMSEQASEFYRPRRGDVASLKTDLGVKYAIAGHIQDDDKALRIDVEMTDTASRANVWSDHFLRERGDPIRVADEAARGITRVLAIEINRLGVLRARTGPSSQLTDDELVSRGYLALGRGTGPKNFADALMSFKAALRHDPHYQPAQLAIARTHIIAAMHFVDLEPSPDLSQDERLLNESLGRSPNSISALYSLALLQKYRGQYQASLNSFRRCLELNPSFLPAQGQIGDILTLMGQPQDGLELILQTIRVASPNDPTIGYWYLFAAEAALELGQNQAALNWALRAEAVMPAAPVVQAWLASIYATAGDKSNAAKYVAALTKVAPARTRLFMNMPADDANSVDDRHGPRIFDGLRLALSESRG